MLTLEKLAEIINENFGEPFLVKDGVFAEVIDEDDEAEPSLCLTIGRRDIQINSEGEVLGSGTCVSMPPNTLELNNDI